MPGLERHWYSVNRHQLYLYPLSLLFRLAVGLRRILYRAEFLPSERMLIPVVVVGNISVGGTGKTPLILALAQQFFEQGWHPVIVSRGYLGKAQQPVHVTANSVPEQVGDEPLLMARREICPVWVGRDRAAAARAALQAHPQCDVVLCDDGLQHYRLQRDVEIAVIDGARGNGNGRMLPAGPLREPAARLREVDAVVVNGGSLPDKATCHSTKLQETAAKSLVIPQAGEEENDSLRKLISHGENASQFGMTLEGAIFRNLYDTKRIAVADDFKATRNHAVAGIGNPQRFFTHLEALGIACTPHPFPDHHAFRANDLTFDECDAILLTEKDAVKCTAFADVRYWVLRVEARIDPALMALILRKIAPHGR